VRLWVREEACGVEFEAVPLVPATPLLVVECHHTAGTITGEVIDGSVHTKAPRSVGVLPVPVMVDPRSLGDSFGNEAFISGFEKGAESSINELLGCNGVKEIDLIEPCQLPMSLVLVIHYLHTCRPVFTG
jgi:hypothetical protein